MRSLVLLLALLQPVPKPSLSQLTAVERQEDHFYGAIAGHGERVRVEWSLPAKAEFGNDITLTLRVFLSANPDELFAPDFVKLEGFSQLFSGISPSEKIEVDGTVTFTWKVRARNPGVFELPELKYRVYTPQAPIGKKFQTAFAKSIPFEAVAPVEKPAPAVPLEAPAEFFQLRTDSVRSAAPPRILWIALFTGVPLIAVVWIAGWHRLFPSSAKLALLRKNRAVRMALDRLAKAERSAEPTVESLAALRGYLIARRGLPPGAITPTEMEISLQSQPISVGRRQELVAYFTRADRVRFAPDSTESLSPASIRDFIVAWEGEAI